MKSAIWRADMEAHLSFTYGKMLVVAFAAEGAISEVAVPIDLRAAVQLVYWLRDEFAQHGVELTTKNGRYRALCEAIEWPEGATI